MRVFFFSSWILFSRLIQSAVNICTCRREFLGVSLSMEALFRSLRSFEWCALFSEPPSLALQRCRRTAPFRIVVQHFVGLHQPELVPCSASWFQRRWHICAVAPELHAVLLQAPGGPRYAVPTLTDGLHVWWILFYFLHLLFFFYNLPKETKYIQDYSVPNKKLLMLIISAKIVNFVYFMES